MILSWKCDICKERRPDEKISVHKVDISGNFNLPEGYVTRNIKYCNDREECQKGTIEIKKI